MDDEAKYTSQKDEQVVDLKMRLAITESVSAERNASDGRYARKIVETIVFGALVIFALAALFFIFTKAGLPIPSIP